MVGIARKSIKNIGNGFLTLQTSSNLSARQKQGI